MLLAFPLFSTRTVPVTLRLGIAAALGVFVAPTVDSGLSTSSSMYELLGCLFKEASVGVLLGFVCGMIFHAIEMAGAIVASEVGLTMSSTFNPMMTSATSPPGMMMHWLGVMLLLTLNLHHWILVGFHRSYALVPVGAAGLGEALLVDGIHRTSALLGTAVQMTAPVMACSFLVTTVFSLLGRSVPQMNVFSESFGFRTMAGLGVFGFTCALASQHIANHLRRIPEDIQKVCTLLTSH